MNMYPHDFIVSNKKFKKFVFLAENQLLRERFKVTLKEIGKEKIILKFFSSISIFCLDTFWYDDRYWKPSPGSTLHDPNDGWAIFDNLSLFLHKMWGS